MPEHQVVEYNVTSSQNTTKFSPCLYRATTVSRHFFIIPNWSTQL